MLDDLDAMMAELRTAEAAAKPRRRRKPTVDRVQISYWSQGEGRFKTRWTTCMFKPSP